METDLRCTQFTRFADAFGIKPGEVISLVGAGGKTSLMFALAGELAAGGGLVVTTTTTKILEPSPGQTQALHLDADDDRVLEWLSQDASRYRHVTIARRRLTSGKLEGISPGLVERIAKLSRVSSVIVEADGAAQRSLKAPNATEPVIPPNTSLVIPVVGVDALGCPLADEFVFRSRIASQLLGLPQDAAMSAGAIAALVTHQRGLAKGSPRQARIIPFINKIDTDGGLEKARLLAASILARRHPRINHVVLGQAGRPNATPRILSCHTAG